MKHVQVINLIKVFHIYALFINTYFTEATNKLITRIEETWNIINYF